LRRLSCAFSEVGAVLDSVLDCGKE
jgi:hypothetical protein